MSSKTAKLLATFFHVGDLPIAPASIASFLGILIYIIFHKLTLIYILLTVIVTIVGFKVCGSAEKYLKEKDPSCIVIDEVAGVMIAVFLLPINFTVLITAFFLFRAFDMFKLYPEERIEKIENSTPIMIDDLLAGVYTNIVMHIAIRWAGFI